MVSSSPPAVGGKSLDCVIAYRDAVLGNGLAGKGLDKHLIGLLLAGGTIPHLFRWSSVPSLPSSGNSCVETNNERKKNAAKEEIEEEAEKTKTANKVPGIRDSLASSDPSNSRLRGVD